MATQLRPFYSMRYYQYDDGFCLFQSFFSLDTIHYISGRVTACTSNVLPNNRPIIVPDDKILSVMNQLWDTYSPNPLAAAAVEDLVNQVISVLVSDIKSNIGRETFINSGDPVSALLAQRIHPRQVKLRHRGPNRGIWNALN